MSSTRNRPPRLAMLAVLAASAASVACSDTPTGARPSPAGPRRDVTADKAQVSYTISFSQLNIEFDNTPREDFTEWGAATVQFVGTSDPVLYANLVVNGDWQVQNVPMLSTNGPGVPVTTTFDVALGPDGVPVNALTYAFALTREPADGMPVGGVGTPVGHSNANLKACVAGGPIGPRAKPAPQVKPPAAKPVDQATNADFPNQEAGVNECGPVATSNSLQWLKKKNKLEVKDADISIDALKKVEGFGPKTGVPLDWYKKKAAYLKDKKVPVATTALATLDQVLAAMKKGCDVEMTVAGQPMSHLVAVSGITKMSDGSFVMQLTHDLKQGQDGGTVTNNVTWDPRTRQFTGAAWINGRAIGQLVSECVTKK
jgi:antitoxin (DNA-binding transcriptional repressor) of toxin-antitoxin stability system